MPQSPPTGKLEREKCISPHDGNETPHPMEEHFHFGGFKWLTDGSYSGISKKRFPMPIKYTYVWIRKKPATISVTTLFHSGTGSET